MRIEDYVTSVGGIVTLGQLRASGFTAAAAQYAVNTQALHRIRRGWLSTRSENDEAVRAVRVGGSLTCVSVLQSLGVWSVADSALHVRVSRHANHLKSPESRSKVLDDREASQVVIHGTFAAYRSSPSCHTDDIDVALMHAIDCQPRNYAVALCDSALNRKLISAAHLSAAASAIGAKHARVVALSDGSAQSGLETIARLRLRSLGITYRTQAFIADVGHVDLLVGDRLVLELDGKEWHEAGDAFSEDRRRDLILHERDYVVMRLTYAQTMFEWARVEALIRRMVAHQKHRWPRSHRGVASAGVADSGTRRALNFGRSAARPPAIGARMPVSPPEVM